MFGHRFKVQHRGHPLPAAEVNKTAREAARHARFRVGAYLAQVVLGGIPLVRGTSSDGCTSFWASLTSHVGAGKYNYAKLVESGGILAGTTPSITGVCYDVNGNATIVCPVVVRVFLDPGSSTYRFQFHFC